jgi:pimeloyl-ACP methyl ester carboxylesterase
MKLSRGLERSDRWDLRRLLVLATAVTVLTAACSGGDDNEESSADDETGETGASADSATAGDDVRVMTLDDLGGPGPAELAQVRVLQQGPEDAENVLVLAPGTSAGAGYFAPVAADIVDELPGWQVWSVDRRENQLEDHSMLDRYLAEDATAQESFDYYLGWIGDESITEHFEPRGGAASDDQSVAFARDWGMNVAIDDLHAVIEEAASLGGKVVLGGHSLGGSITVAYATWDFDGRAGAEDLSGLVLIDGGSGAGQAPTVADAQAELDALETASPFNDIVNLNLPWAAGVFNALGSGAALMEPDEPSLGWVSPLIPDNLKPPVAPTNAAQYGYALDTETSPDGLELVQLHLGHLADSGDPRPWVDAELVTVERAARMFSGAESMDGTAWYHPQRLSIDSGAVNGGIANPAQDLLDVHATHGTELDLPIYALQTQFGAGRVLAGAQLLADQADIPDDELTLVDESDRLTHTDPMAVETDQNPLVETLVPYLRDLG